MKPKHSRRHSEDREYKLSSWRGNDLDRISYMRFYRFVSTSLQNDMQKGQALVTLLFFSVIGLTVVMGSVMVILANSLSGTRFQQGNIAYEIAQSGMDNALLRLLRDPSYTGETLPVDSGSAAIAVAASGTNTYTLTSVGIVGNFTRKVQATVTYSNNDFQVTGRKEIQ